MSMFPADEDTHPVATVLKILIMTAALLIAGVGIYWYSQRSLRMAALANE
jgi:hypothetical protein